MTGLTVVDYYIRNSKKAGIEGPFTVEQINQMLQQGALDLNSLGLADEGQGIRSAQNSRKNDWINLVHVPQVTGHFPGHEEKRTRLLRGLAIVIIALGLLAALGFAYLMSVLRQIR
jgi:hypothetical protein